MGHRLTCENPAALFKPQWAYKTPAGYRDDFYLIPFSFQVPADGMLHLGFPVQLDDDVPYLIRGIIFPMVGTAQPLYNQIPPLAFPGLVRMWDSHGNPLTEGLVLALGVWAQSGFSDANTPTGINAFGFPLEPEVECSPGGAVIFDFQLNTNAVPATFTDGTSSLLLASSVYGTAGNATTIHLVNPGAPNVALSVAVAGSAVTVTLATNGASALTSTWSDVAAAINGNAAAAALMSAVVLQNGSTVATAIALTNLAGGAAANATPITVTGSLLGVKRFKDC
jgi:hypothetical protein